MRDRIVASRIVALKHGCSGHSDSVSLSLVLVGIVASSPSQSDLSLSSCLGGTIYAAQQQFPWCTLRSLKPGSLWFPHFKNIFLADSRQTRRTPLHQDRPSRLLCPIAGRPRRCSLLFLADLSRPLDRQERSWRRQSRDSSRPRARRCLGRWPARASYLRRELLFPSLFP